jgi:hypothetical protein
MADVFISYAREDSDFVHLLSSALKTKGRETSIDTQDLSALCPSAVLCAGSDLGDRATFFSTRVDLIGGQQA